MDLIQKLAESWKEMVLGWPLGLQAYVIRVGVGLTVAYLLAIGFVRRPGAEEESTRLKQIAVTAVLVLIPALLPAGWIRLLAPAFHGGAITLCLFTVATLPWFLPASLVRTYGRQILARRLLYGMVVFGLLVQIAICGGE